MHSELEQHLYKASKEDLVQLFQELAVRHPVLREEMEQILANFSVESFSNELPSSSVTEEADEEVLDDWDFSGDEPISIHTFPQPMSSPMDSEARQQLIERYATHLRQQITPQGLLEDLSALVEEAITHVGHNDYESALDLYALMFDERLLERSSALVSTFDEMIDAAMPSLESLLAEASSSTMLDVSSTSLVPLLVPQVRQHWLERLFALWLRRLDAHKIEEDLPEIMLDVAWSEDIQLLRGLAQNELQSQPRGPHSNIVDFARQYRTKALEKFLKELPRT